MIDVNVDLNVTNISIEIPAKFERDDLIVAANKLIEYNHSILGKKTKAIGFLETIKIRKRNAPFLCEYISIFDKKFFIIKGAVLRQKAKTILTLYLEGKD